VAPDSLDRRRSCWSCCWCWCRLGWNRQIQRRVHAKTKERQERCRSLVEQEPTGSCRQPLFGTAASGPRDAGGYLLMANPAHAPMLATARQELE
jgi:hypothetical protein